MENIIWLVLGLLTLMGSGVDEVRAKCSPTPLEGVRRRWIAYACVQGDFDDVNDVPNEAEWIEFTVSQISKLPADGFSRFRNLRRLTFYDCNIREFNPEAFRGCDNLEWLVLSNTRIGLARSSLFRHLRNLKRLTLDGAGLVYVEPEVFHNLRKLETLSLRDNDLDCLPIHGLASLTSLKTVQIGRNPWLCDCRNSLRKFFDDRRIVHGPDEECRILNDTSVNPCKARVYDCMTTLDYPALPAPQASFAQIESHYHGRFEWRDSVALASGIENLDRLPDESSWIQIVGIEIPTITRYAFFRFGNTLRSIEMTDCGVREIEEEAFAGLHKLERLTMVGNGLVAIGNDWFRDLGRLHELILRRNAIERFEERSLVHLRELRILDIAENRLACLHEDRLRGLVALQRLEVSGNPWICGCRTDLENYLIKTRIGYAISSGRCELRNIATNEPYEYKFNRNSTTIGKIRWSWASKTHWPPVPRPTWPMTTPTPVIAYHPTPTKPPRTGGCRIINHSGHRTKIDNYSCTGSSLSDLSDVPVTVEIIKFSNSVIETIYNDAFVKFGHYLRQLEFRECSIQRLENRAFRGLWSLETLVIRNNYLEVVESRWFEQMRNLRALDLSKNRITRIENGVFDRLPLLSRLDVSDNQMNCIGTEHLEGLRYLRELEVNGNPWTCLCATKLVQILKQRAITCHCDPDVLIQQNEGGWGCGNDVHPTTSTTWQISPTQLATTRNPSPSPDAPPTTSAPPTMLPGPPSGTCYTSHETLEGRQSYNCGDGNISVLLHIPDNATKIEIRESYIPKLPAKVFERFENLTDLALINCTLSDIDQRAFDGLNKLEKLTLRHNRFTILRNGWFSETKNIVSIDLSDNDLSEIEIGSFVGLNRLEYLNFEGNAFRCIYTSCLVGIPRLATVEFGRNNRRISWRCWQELEEYLTVRGINYTNHKCPHNGRNLVKSLLKDDQAQSATGGATDLAIVHSTKILVLCIVVVVRFYV